LSFKFQDLLFLYYFCSIKNRLKNTKLILASLDGEEIGQRGAKAFIRKYRNKLKELDTIVINIDSFYNYKNFTLFTTDRNGTYKLSKKLNRELKDFSDKKGYSIALKPHPFGGGGTDAWRFEAAGVPSVSLIGMSTSLIFKDIYYHSSMDVVSNIEPAAVQAVMDLLLDFIYYRDNK
jgi:Zn-dependent M28 family amino/carboxypeptidase